jgi:hypothetical protein
VQETGKVNEEFKKGVVFYLNKDKKVVGALLWNLHGKLKVVRNLIKEGKTYEDVDKLSSLINVYK